MAPPFGFTFSLSSGKPNSRVTASACAAKASFNSKRSMFFTDKFNLRKKFSNCRDRAYAHQLGLDPGGGRSDYARYWRQSKSGGCFFRSDEKEHRRRH